MKILKSFFCNSEGKFMPPYFWISCLMLITLTMFVLRLTPLNELVKISDTLLLGVLGLVVGWCAVYNSGKKGKLTETIKETVSDIVKKTKG